MSDFEMVIFCILIPIIYILTYIAGKYDILKIVCEMLKENVKCEHEWHVEEKSNALQLDDMGYPLRLYICRCAKCGASDQQWRDVPVSEVNDLKTGESFLLAWKNLKSKGTDEGE